MDEDCLDLFLDWGYDDVVVKSEYANDTAGDFMISDDNEYYDDAVLPLTSSTSSPLITSPPPSSSASSSASATAATTTVIKQEVSSSSSSSSSSWQYISPNHEDMPNTKTLLFGSNDSKNQFTFPSIEIFPAVISGPWNDPNYYGSDDEEEDDEINNGNNSKKKRKRQRSPNPDYELITAATETNLRLLNINPDSKEGKAQRRRIRNKISAQMHRERKKAYIVYLENIVRHRESTILNMKERMDILILENDELKLKINKVGSNTKETVPIQIKDQLHDYTTEYVTSSDDDEDTNSIHSKGTSSSSLSISSPMSDPSSSKFGSKFSLFSILFMFGFTFFGPLNPVNNTGSGVSLFQTPSLLGYSNVVNRDSLLQLAPPSLTSEYVNSDLDVQISGRVLLSLPTEGSTDTMVNTGNPLPKLKITPISSLPIPSISKSKALWKYQDRVMHLFPKLALPDPTAQGVGKRRHLRSRDSHPTTNYETALVPIYSSYDFDETDTKSKSQPSTSPSSISRVLLTEGKALLDPTLASGRVVQHVDKSQKEDKAGLSLALSSWSSSDTSSSHYQSSHASPVYSVSVRPQDSNVLVMLLPANQIRWGKSWEEGKDTISSGLDFDFPTDNINGYSKDDIDSAWVEIGCSVFKAQLVKNVTMI